ncbi:MAG: hypothetical protein CVU47_07325 [Chloroflexi bacterium HGW-Chloroflexi-9]|nr:MAG: hypothetical protein CVU47_07325 [Chloroflexi bacterium HGW-Chloroflexi-9]
MRRNLTGIIGIALAGIGVAAGAACRMLSKRREQHVEAARTEEEIARFEDEGGPAAGPGPADA